MKTAVKKPTSKIYGIEPLLATHVRMIYVMERTMERLSPTAVKQIEK